MAGNRLHTGTVVEFDDPAGLGEVRDDDGARHPFHCTAIAGSTRTTEIDARVRFTLAAARPGRIEARALTPAST
jgi:cold shock CspA family protein